MASSSTTGGCRRRICSSASSPFSAVTTRYPSISRMKDTVSRMLGSSSTSKISGSATTLLRPAHHHDGTVVDKRCTLGEHRDLPAHGCDQLRSRGRAGRKCAAHALDTKRPVAFTSCLADAVGVEHQGLPGREDTLLHRVLFPSLDTKWQPTLLEHLDVPIDAADQRSRVGGGGEGEMTTFGID